MTRGQEDQADEQEEALLIRARDALYLTMDRTRDNKHHVSYWLWDCDIIFLCSRTPHCDIIFLCSWTPQMSDRFFYKSRNPAYPLSKTSHGALS